MWEKDVAILVDWMTCFCNINLDFQVAIMLCIAHYSVTEKWEWQNRN